MIAYSSVAQLAFITLGIFSLRAQGAQGALLQMLNHGIVTAAAFFVVATVAARCGGSEDLRVMGGVAFRAPVLATMFLIVTFANLAMPGSSNFIGEFMILLGTFDAKTAIAVIAFIGVVAAAFYGLRLFITSMHNRVGSAVVSSELRAPEAIAIIPLIAVIFALALYPQFGLSRSQASLNSAVAPVAALTGQPVPNDVASTRTAALVVIPAACTGRPIDWSDTLMNLAVLHPVLAHHIAGPTINWKGILPLVVLTGGGLVLLLVGLIRNRSVREQLDSGADAPDPARRARNRDRPAESAGRRRRRLSVADRRAGAADRHDLRRRRDRDRAVLLAGRRPARRRPGRVLLAARSSASSGWRSSSRRRI